MDHRHWQDIVARVDFYMSGERFESAENYLLNLLEDSHEARLYNQLGVVYHKQSKFDLALKQFEKAVIVDKNYTEGFLNLIVTLADLGLYEQAQDQFKKISTSYTPSNLSSFHKLGEAHLVCAEIYKDLQDYGKAQVEFEKALAILPENIDFLFKYSKFLLENNKLNETIKILERIEELDLENIEAIVLRGIATFKLGRNTQARDLWEKARKLSPESPLVRSYYPIALTLPHS